MFAAIIGVIVIRLLVLRESRNERSTSDACGECGVVELVSPDDEKGSVEQNKAGEK